MSTTNTSNDLAYIGNVKNIKGIRFDSPIVRIKHGKKKKIINNGGYYFSVIFKNGDKWTLANLVKAVNEVDSNNYEDIKALAPFCDKLISKNEIHLKAVALRIALNLEVTEELRAQAIEEEKKINERIENKEKKIIEIVKGGVDKYVKNEKKRAGENAKKRFEFWKDNLKNWQDKHSEEKEENETK